MLLLRKSLSIVKTCGAKFNGIYLRVGVIFHTKEITMFMYLSNRIQRIQESLNDEFITDDEYSYLHDELRELQLEFDKLFN